ncbi:hypothetical protein [Mesorhizobium huakuii]|uniref:hypothetical protein n=1 Tax=Mesorhizobium huakuii TaxID=28104 RepID=UPI0024E16BA4|nr:hypothetical protein [Mesorhizobium huakuii]
MHASIAHDAFASFAKSAKILENVSTPQPVGKDTKGDLGDVVPKTVENDGGSCLRRLA